MSIESVLAKSGKVARRQFTAARKKNLADIPALNWRNEAVRRSLHKEVDWLRRDFSFVRQQILSASEESVGVCKPTSSVRPSQRGYRLVAKKRVLRVLRFD